MEEIKTLTALEHIRLKPEMYIGVLGDGSKKEDGIYQLLKYVMNNSVEQFQEGYCSEIIIYLSEDNVAVVDNGAGIPHDRLHVRTKVHDWYGGRTGTDIITNHIPSLAIVNALSEEFYVASYQDNECMDILYRRGVLMDNEACPVNKEKKTQDRSSGLTVSFAPDSEIFGNYKFEKGIVESIIQDFKEATPGLNITLYGN